MAKGGSNSSGETSGLSASEGGGYSASNTGSVNTNNSNESANSGATDTGSSSLSNSAKGDSSDVGSSSSGISFSGLDFSQPNGGLNITPSFMSDPGLQSSFSSFYGSNNSENGISFNPFSPITPSFSWDSFNPTENTADKTPLYTAGNTYGPSEQQGPSLNNGAESLSPNIGDPNETGNQFGPVDKSATDTNAEQRNALDDIPWTFSDDTSESKKGRNEISVEEAFFKGLAGDYGKTEQDIASGNLRDSYTYSEAEKAAQKVYDKSIKKGKTEDESLSAAGLAWSKAEEKAGKNYDRTYDGKMLANAYKNFNDTDMANEKYASLVDAAKQGFGDQAQEAIQAAGGGKSEYASMVNNKAVEDKNAFGSSEKKAKENRKSNQTSELGQLASQSSRGKGLIGEIGDSLGAGINNAGYNLGNIGDNVYTAVGGVNKYGNSWADTHGGNLNRQEGDARTGDKNYLGRVGDNALQGLRNAGDKVDTFFGGANNETGLANHGMAADRNGDGKVDFGERVANMAQRAFLGKESQQYDINGDGKISSDEAIVGGLNHLTDFSLIGDKAVEAGKDRMKNNGGKWYNNVLGAMQVGGGYLLNVLHGAAKTAVNPLAGFGMGVHGMSELALNDAKKYGGFENVPQVNNPTVNGPTGMSMEGHSASTPTLQTTAPDDSQTKALQAALRSLNLKTNSNGYKEGKGWDWEKIQSLSRDATTLRKNQVAISDARLKDYVYRTVMTPDIMDTMSKLVIMNYQPQDSFGALWKTQQLLR